MPTHPGYPENPGYPGYAEYRELSQFRRSIALDLLFTLLTCGIYSLFWKYKQFQAVNALLGERRHRYWMWLLLTLITCGIYNIYNVWAVARDVVRLEGDHALHSSEHLPLVSLLLALFGFVILADSLIQNEINQLVERIATKKTPSIEP